MKADLLDNAPPGSQGVVHPSGWMQSDIFLQWFEHFVRQSHPTADSPVLLILDGHKTHTTNLAVINMAREQHVSLLCLPPHCSHRLQPLDVTFMKPLNAFYVQEIECWLLNHPGRVVTIQQVPELFRNAYLRAAYTLTAVNGLPLSLSSLNAEGGPVIDMPTHSAQTSNQTLISPPSCGSDADAGNTASQNLLNRMHVLEVSPLPKATERTTSEGSRAKGKTVVLTSSPYKLELMKKRQLIQNKESRANAKKARKLGMDDKSSGTPAPGSSRSERKKKKQTVRADKGRIPALPRRPTKKGKGESKNTENKKAQTNHATEEQCVCGTWWCLW